MDQRKKELVKEIAENRRPDVPQSGEDVLKEKWQQELQDVEQRRNGSLSKVSTDAEEVEKGAESTVQPEAVPEELGQVGSRQ